MLRLFWTLTRGAAAEAEEAVFDANAIKLLEQQLRDAAAALDRTRRELALAMAQRTAEERRITALQGRIGELETSAIDAINGGREDLAKEAATAIARAEDELRERRETLGSSGPQIARLRHLLDEGEARLIELKRGLETARVQDRMARAGVNGRQAVAIGTGALLEAEATLARIQNRNQLDDDAAEALDALDRTRSGRDLDERMSAAGFGKRPKTASSDVLDRIRQKAADGANAGSDQRQSSAPPVDGDPK